MDLLWEDLRGVGLDAGLDAVGVARAEPFLEARRHLVERKAAGLHGGMHFTYGNPERATDPASVLPRFINALPTRFVVGDGPVIFNAAQIDIDPATGRALAIERIARLVEV